MPFQPDTNTPSPGGFVPDSQPGKFVPDASTQQPPSRTGAVLDQEMASRLPEYPYPSALDGAQIDVPPTQPTISAIPSEWQDIKSGHLQEAFDNIYEPIRRQFSGILGPTDKERLENSVPWGKNEDGTVAYAYKPLGNRMDQEQGLFTPYLKIEPLKPDKDDTAMDAVGKSVFNVAAGLLGNIESPGGVATLGTGGTAGKVISSGFAADMIAHIPEQIKEAINAPDKQGKIQGWLGAITSALMAGHVIKNLKTPTTTEGGDSNEPQKGKQPPPNDERPGSPEPKEQHIPPNSGESRQGGSGQPSGNGGDVSKTSESGWRLSPSDTLNLNAKDKTPSSQITRVRKITNDQGKVIYAVDYQRPDGVKYIGYTDDPSIEFHPKYEGEYKSQSTPQLIPAIKTDGGTVTGKPGDTHADITARAGKVDDVDTVVAAGDDANHVFTTPDGQVLDRQAAGEYADENGLRPDKYTGKPLQSQHLNELASTQGVGSVGPGAASIEEPLSQGPQLKQVTDTLKSQTQDTPLLERISNAVKSIPSNLRRGAEATVEDIGSTIGASMARAKAVGTAISDAFTKLPVYTEFQKALGDWQGALQRNDRYVYEFAKQIKRTIPDAGKREAITNWIQADGNEDVLRQRRDDSKPVIDASGKTLLSKRKAAALARGYDAALNLTDDEKVVAENLRQYFDSMLQEGTDAGIFKNGGVDNYVTQMWKRANPVTGQLVADAQSGKLSTNFRYARQRIYDSFFEGERAGRTPVTKDIGALVSVYDQAFGATKAARAFVKQLSEGKASDGRPLVTIRGGASTATEPIEGMPEGPAKVAEQPSALLIKPKIKPADAADYQNIDHPALRGWKWVGTDEHGNPILLNGDMVVHPEALDKLKNVLGRSAIGKIPGVTEGLKLQSTLKATKLSLSAFHQVQEGLHAIWHRVNPIAPERINLEDPAQYELVTHGLQVSDHRALAEFSEGLSGHGGLLDKLPGVGGVLRNYQDWLFREYIPGLKMAMAKHVQERNMARFGDELKSGKITKDQVLELSARQANAAFGEQNYRYMARNPTFQDLLRIGFLAPDFLESRMRFVGQAMTKYGTEQRTALALMVGAMWLGARVLNKTLDDDYHWNEPFNVDIKGTRYGVRSIAGDVENLWNDPRRFIYNRLSPLTRGTTEAIMGVNDRGIKRSTFQQFQDLAEWLIPITLEKPTGGDTRTQQALAAAGVTSYTPTGKRQRGVAKPPRIPKIGQ